ncbi:MAG: cation:proton antiporter [Methylomonas lenta]|nr:cation:proton antiporter [Methylomonas lenta]
MIFIAVFLLTVFLYSLVSRRLERTVVTAPIIFTLAGMLLYSLPSVSISDLVLERHGFLWVAEIGLVMTLFTDAAHISFKHLITNRSLPFRLLTTGMLLTILLGAIAAVMVFPGINVWQAGILAAILAPTDAGLGAVIVNSPKVPLRIREALNIEAGLNDGLSVPFLMCFIALVLESSEAAPALLSRFMLEQIGYGSLIGFSIGAVGGWLLELACRKKWMAAPLQQLGLVALPLMCVLASEASGASMFIAAYIGGFAVQICFTDAGKHSVEFTETWGQLFDFFVFFLFGVLVAQASTQFDFTHLIYALLSLTLVRMLPVAMALAGSGLSRSTVLFMGWFGPRGLASIVLGLVYLEQELNIPGEATVKLAIMMTVLLSIFAHGFSALPGINIYLKRIAGLHPSAAEFKGIDADDSAG